MTTPPLSPAAQAVRKAFLDAPSGIALSAAFRALVDATLPTEEPLRGGMRPGGRQPVTPDEFRQAQRQHTRAKQLAIAAELYGGEGQHTTQLMETASDSER